MKGVKNVKKSAMIEVLAKWCHSRKVYDDYRIKMGSLENNNDDEQQEGSSGTTMIPRKGIQCAFRLMNLLFSDAFADEFGHKEWLSG